MARTDLQILRDRVAVLEQQRQEQRSLEETSDSVPFRLTPDLALFTHIGPQAERLFGIAAERWLEPGFFESRLSPQDHGATLEQCRVVVEFCAQHEAEFRFRRDDGTWIWLRCAMQLFESSEGPRIAGHLTDVSVRRELASDQAQSQKLEALGRIAAGVAHEVNTPIQFTSDSLVFVQDGVATLLEMVERYRAACAGLPADARAALAEHEEAVDLDYVAENLPKALASSGEGLSRVATLVRSLKDFARPDGQDRVHADLNHALASTLVIAANEYRFVADVETDFGAIPTIDCYVSELNQVFLNIVVNAAHAITDVVGASGGRGKIRIATRVEAGDVVVAISDTGAGIPMHVQDRIFEPFFTTKDVGKGSGQGLSIARTIIAKHGGSLSFETAPGAGTTFFMRLPTG